MVYDYLRDEYTEVMRNYRFYGNMRFAVLTGFIALTAGLLTLFVKIEPSFQQTIQPPPPVSVQRESSVKIEPSLQQMIQPSKASNI
jgi:hypothetical protein